MKHVWTLSILVVYLSCLTGCVPVCNRSGPNDCYGAADCWHTKRAFAKYECKPVKHCSTPFRTPR